MTHRNACPVFSATTFSRFFLDRPYILGPLAIVFGLVVAFAGRKFFPWTIAIIGAAIGAGTALLLFSMFDILDSIKSVNPQETTLFVFFQYFVALTTGLFLGFILQKMLHIGAAILGAFGGFFIGLAVYQFFFFYTESELLLSALGVLGSVVMAVMSFRNYDNIVIFGTAFVGSYAFLRGLSLFVGDFPNELQMFQQLLSG